VIGSVCHAADLQPLSEVSMSHDPSGKRSSGSEEAAGGEILKFTSQLQPQCRWVGVRQLVEDALSSFDGGMKQQRVCVKLDVPSGELAWVDREMLHRAVKSLAQRALDGMHHGGDLVVTSYSFPEEFELEIADSGPGLSEAPTDLAAVRRIVGAHGGTFLARNCPEGGAAYMLKFPFPRQALEAAA
jgi:two-component system sensor histidine kinase HydH